MRNSDSQTQTARQNCLEEISEELQRNSDEPQPAQTKEDAEERNDFWSIEGDFIYRHHNEPRVHLHVPKEETFPIPTEVY